MQQALHEVVLPAFIFPTGESVFAQPVAHDVARLLELCLNPQDEMLIRAAMATGFARLDGDATGQPE